MPSRDAASWRVARARRARAAGAARQEQIDSMTPLPELEAARPAAAMPGHTLAIGTRLREYEVKGLIGEGTCSIVYLAWDHALQRKVAIKEYMPASLVGRVRGSADVVVAADRHVDSVRTGLASFVNEARLLARFDHPSLVKVYRFWEENGTAYMVMPYYEGPTLKAALADLGHVPSEDELRTWLKPILNAVAMLHESGTWHQNIGPDEIVLTPFGPVLLGIAAASHAIQALRHTPAAALKPGFAAIEQYGGAAGSTRGPWTDLYALAAVIYTAITGTDPLPAADRLARDALRPLAAVAAGLYSARFLAAIDAALAVQPKQRPADHLEFRALMGDIDAPRAVTLTPRPDLMQEPFAAARPDEREVTVPDRPLLASPEPPAPAATAHAAHVAAPGGARPPPATRPMAAPAGTGPRPGPSWMRTASARAFGKRALYSAIAGSFALIGIAALVVQVASRSGQRPPSAPASAHALPATASTTPVTVATTVLPASRGPAAVAPAATRSTPVATSAVMRSTAAPAAVAPAPPPAALIASPLERQARCTEILQKASLEKITTAETDFFKRECK
jgi:serine/threonine protein kinase